MRRGIVAAALFIFVFNRSHTRTQIAAWNLCPPFLVFRCSAPKTHTRSKRMLDAQPPALSGLGFCCACPCAACRYIAAGSLFEVRCAENKTQTYTHTREHAQKQQTARRNIPNASHCVFRFRSARSNFACFIYIESCWGCCPFTPDSHHRHHHYRS